MRSYHLFISMMLSTSIFSASTAIAAEQALLDMPLEQLMEIEVKEVYSASKFEQKVTQAPSAITIVDANDIVHYGYRTLADILRSVRGFYTFSDSKYEYIGVRGFGRLGDFNNRILLLLDGHRINDSVYDYAAIGTDFPLDVDLIKRVEIVRGPGSSLYGTNAFFAVINVITKDGADYAGGEISALAGKHQQRQGRVTFGNTFGNDTQLLFSATASSSDGRQRIYYPEYDDPATNNGIAEDLDSYSARKLLLKLSHGGFSLHAGYSRRIQAYSTADYFTVFNDPHAEVIDRQYYLEIDNRWPLTADSELFARIYHDDYQFDGTYPYDYGVGYTVLNQQYTKNNSWGGELQYSAMFGRQQHLILGAEYRQAEEQKILNYDVFGTYADVKQTPSDQALYIQDEIRLANHWLVNAGLRRDSYDSFGSHLSPRLSMIYQPVERFSIKLLYGEAFRAPSTFELYFGDGISQKANPDLKPEVITTYELVIDHYLASQTRLAASFFRYHMSDLIELQTDPGDGLLVYRNNDKARAYGIELEAERDWSADLKTLLSYSYQSAEESADNTDLSNSPYRLAKLNISMPIISAWGNLGFETQCMGARRTRLNARINGYCLANVTISRQSQVSGLDVSASIYNLFDKQYADPVVDSHLMDTLEQGEMTFWLKITYR